MDVAVFSTKPYDKVFLNTSNAGFGHNLQFYESRLLYERGVGTPNAVSAERIVK